MGMFKVWAEGEGSTGSAKQGTSLSGSETVQVDDRDASCVWCEQKVRVTGAVCDIDCYSLLYGWAIRNTLLGLVDFDGFDTLPLPLEQQPWYAEQIGLT